MPPKKDPYQAWMLRISRPALKLLLDKVEARPETAYSRSWWRHFAGTVLLATAAVLLIALTTEWGRSQYYAWAGTVLGALVLMSLGRFPSRRMRSPSALNWRRPKKVEPTEHSGGVIAKWQVEADLPGEEGVCFVVESGEPVLADERSSMAIYSTDSTAPTLITPQWLDKRGVPLRETYSAVLQTADKPEEVEAFIKWPGVAVLAREMVLSQILVGLDCSEETRYDLLRTFLKSLPVDAIPEVFRVIQTKRIHAARPLVRDHFNHEAFVVRAAAATAAGYLDDRESEAELLTLLSDPTSRVRQAAAFALGLVGGAEALRRLRVLTYAEDGQTRLVIKTAEEACDMIVSRLEGGSLGQLSVAEEDAAEGGLTVASGDEVGALSEVD